MNTSEKTAEGDHSAPRVHSTLWPPSFSETASHQPPAENHHALALRYCCTPTCKVPELHLLPHWRHTGKQVRSSRCLR